MRSKLTESEIEEMAIERLEALGYKYLHGGILAFDGPQERTSYADVILDRRLREAVTKFNPNIPVSERETAIKDVISKNTGLDNEKCQNFVIKSLTEHVELERSDIDKVVWDVLPAWMDDEKKRHRIERLLRLLRKAGKIQNRREGPKSIWRLTESND